MNSWSLVKAVYWTPTWLQWVESATWKTSKSVSVYRRNLIQKHISIQPSWLSWSIVSNILLWSRATNYEQTNSRTSFPFVIIATKDHVIVVCQSFFFCGCTYFFFCYTSLLMEEDKLFPVATDKEKYDWLFVVNLLNYFSQLFFKICSVGGIVYWSTECE